MRRGERVDFMHGSDPTVWTAVRCKLNFAVQRVSGCCAIFFGSEPTAPIQVQNHFR